MNHSRMRSLVGAGACVVFALAGGDSQAADPIGSEEYKVCAACHGKDGKGDGPMRGLLTEQPADLTRLTANNGGVFPYERVMQMIDGRSPVAAHGSSDMPIWGSRYSAQFTGAGGGLGAEMEVRARILSIVYHLESIQE